MKILINQGANTMAANTAGQMLNQVVENINQHVKEDTLTALEKQGAALKVQQAGALASLISKKTENVNETGAYSANGNAPVSLVQLL
ncbi:hypothetical protein [Bacillus swezeyi]|uniref:hypothetical protein n=1 Tax=Bacillus swezeyi TaxID=1925020 RepID=UPI003F8CCE34